VTASALISIEVAGKSYSQAMRAAEAAILIAALNAANGNKHTAAETLGMSYDNFRRKVGSLKIRQRFEVAV
jgi:DNA-binding NtrC family response regulator